MTTDVTLRARELAAMSDADFIDELNNNMGNFTVLKPFVDHANAARTREALEDMIAMTDGDLIKYEGRPETDPDWVLRAKGFRRIAQRAISQLNRADTLRQRKNATEARAWRAFAHQLCDALDKELPREVLEDIILPFDMMTARAWFDRRLEKRNMVSAV